MKIKDLTFLLRGCSCSKFDDTKTSQHHRLEQREEEEEEREGYEISEEELIDKSINRSQMFHSSSLSFSSHSIYANENASTLF